MLSITVESRCNAPARVSPALAFASLGVESESTFSVALVGVPVAFAAAISTILPKVGWASEGAEITLALATGIVKLVVGLANLLCISLWANTFALVGILEQFGPWWIGTANLASARKCNTFTVASGGVHPVSSSDITGTIGQWTSAIAEIGFTSIVLSDKVGCLRGCAGIFFRIADALALLVIPALSSGAGLVFLRADTRATCRDKLCPWGVVSFTICIRIKTEWAITSASGLVKVSEWKSIASCSFRIRAFASASIIIDLGSGSCTVGWYFDTSAPVCATDAFASFCVPDVSFRGPSITSCLCRRWAVAAAMVGCTSSSSDVVRVQARGLVLWADTSTVVIIISFLSRAIFDILGHVLWATARAILINGSALQLTCARSCALATAIIIHLDGLVRMITCSWASVVLCFFLFDAKARVFDTLASAALSVGLIDSGVISLSVQRVTILHQSTSVAETATLREWCAFLASCTGLKSAITDARALVYVISLQRVDCTAISIRLWQSITISISQRTST